MKYYQKVVAQQFNAGAEQDWPPEVYKDSLTFPGYEHVVDLQGCLRYIQPGDWIINEFDGHKHLVSDEFFKSIYTDPQVDPDVFSLELLDKLKDDLIKFRLDIKEQHKHPDALAFAHIFGSLLAFADLLYAILDDRIKHYTKDKSDA